MLKHISILIFSLLALFNSSFACTTFFIEKNGQMVFGKNYDWSTGAGSINTNLRGLSKSSLPLDDGKILRWTSKYGSTTFNQYGKEFPNGGMNEKGLVVELMWLSESEYPAQDKRPGLSVLQWIQYQLDNSSTIQDVIATDKLVRIISTNTPQHYLVADSKGAVATIEFLHGKMVVHQGNNLPNPVLTNSTYETSMKAFPSATNKNNSLTRFSNACSMVKEYKTTNILKPLVDYSFEILNKVAQGNFTKWSIVYDITNRTIHFKTSENKTLRSFSLNNFKYECNDKALSYNIQQQGKGNISNYFTSFSAPVNKTILKQAFKQSEGLNINEELQNAIANYPATVKCV